MRNLDARRLALYAPREPGEKLAASFLGVDPAQVLLTNGADEGIHLICQAYLEAGDEIVVIVPAFAMYEVFAQTTGAKVVRVPAGPEFQFPREKVLAAIGPRTRVLVITNPNNPTGIAVERSDILKVLAAAPDAAVLLDEAYFDFYGKTVIDQVGKIPNLFVARTFSKAYGLAGLRLGVMAGHAEQISVLRRMCPPFNCNVIALECLEGALADEQSVAAYVHQVKTTREWLKRQLESMGVRCWPSHTNFLLCQFGTAKADVLKTARAHGISLRDRPDCEGCIRISIGTQQEMERVLTTLKKALTAIPATQVNR